MDEEVQAPKKVIRKRATKAKPEEAEILLPPVSSAEARKETTFTEVFDKLLNQITQSRQDFEKLQKEVTETREAWQKEQKDFAQALEQRMTQEEVERKREEELYIYDRDRKRQKEEDEFLDKKASWERQLREQKEVIEKDRQELEDLRKMAANFDNEKERIVKEAKEALEKELLQSFENEKKLREQEIKSQIEILNLKISNLTSENSRQLTEIESLKKSLDQATGQIKEIAVKVIESGGSSKTIQPQET